MTTNSASFNPSVPYEAYLYERLADPAYAGHYLAAAYEDELENPGTLEQAITHIIHATAEKNPVIAICALTLPLDRLNANALLKLAELLEISFNRELQARIFQSSHFFQLLRDLTDTIPQTGMDPFTRAGFSREAIAPTEQMKQAFSEFTAA